VGPGNLVCQRDRGEEMQSKTPRSMEAGASGSVGALFACRKWGVRTANGVGAWAGATVHRCCGMGSKEGGRDHVILAEILAVYKLEIGSGIRCVGILDQDRQTRARTPPCLLRTFSPPPRESIAFVQVEGAGWTGSA
jgi:hypothetical protein